MKIIEKIKALLAKATSTDNENEAEIFFAKAYELMEKHQLDTSDLETDDPMGEEVGVTAKGRGGVDWNERLMFAVARYYGCKAIQNHRGKDVDMVVVGRVSARITAIEMHKYLVKTVRRLGRERCHEMRCNADTAARRIGVALKSRISSLCPKPEVAPTQAGKNALITLDALTIWVEKNHPDLHTIKGVTYTNNLAKDIANGIGLNLQTGHSATLRLS